MSVYYISGLFYNFNKPVCALVHEVENEIMHQGVKIDLKTIADEMLANQRIFFTCFWDYRAKKWEKGFPLEKSYPIDGKTYFKTTPNDGPGGFTALINYAIIPF